MAKDRALRRAEREAEAARTAEERERRARRAAARARRGSALARAWGWVVWPFRRVAGWLAAVWSSYASRGRNGRIALAAVVGLVALSWWLADSWMARFAALGVAALLTPVALVLAGGRPRGRR